MSSMIRAVFFDVDGVLMHPWKFRDHLASHHGITPEITAPFFEGPFVECLLGQADLRAVLPRYLAGWGWNGSVSEFIDAWFAIENVPDEAVLKLANEVRQQGIACFIASTQERLRAEYIAADMGFAGVFDRLFFSCHLAVKKPDVAFFQAVAQQVALPPETLLFIDDMPSNIEGAKAAGWQAAQFTDAATLQEHLNSYLRPVPAG